MGAVFVLLNAMGAWSNGLGHWVSTPEISVQF